jgi:hypothetical protein
LPLSFFFFFVSAEVDVEVVDDVSVIIVSVGGGGAVVSVAAVSVCGRCSRGCGCGARSRGIAGVVLPTVSVTTGAFVTVAGRVDVRGRDGCATPGVPAAYEGADGIADAIEPSVPRGAGFVGSVRLVVVSTFVFVIGGGVSPGPLIVDVTPLAEPSCTV